MGDVDGELVELRGALAAVQARLESLEHENAALRAAGSGGSAPQVVDRASAPAASGAGPLSRRHLLARLVGAAAAGVGVAAVGSAARPRPASAASSVGAEAFVDGVEVYEDRDSAIWAKGGGAGIEARGLVYGVMGNVFTQDGDDFFGSTVPNGPAGVIGSSVTTVGVRGHSDADDGVRGVSKHATHSGVSAENLGAGFGAYAISATGIAVSAITRSGAKEAVYARSDGGTGLSAHGGAYGVRATSGPGSGIAQAPPAAAVWGDSASRPAVAGTSANNDGVLGISNNDAFSGVSARNLGKGYGLFARSVGGTAVDAATTGAGVAVRAASAAAAAIVSQSTQNDGAHLVSNASGRSGVFGENTSSGYGVYGGSAAGIGLVGKAPVPLWLVPSTQTGPPSTAGQVGQLYVDSAGDLYVCGTGGTWRKVATGSGGGGGGGLQVLATPRRLMDSRGGAPITHSSTKVAKGEVYAFQVAGNVGVPVGATAVTGSIAVFQPEAAGYLRLFPAQLASSTTSVINFANGQTIANAFTAALSSDGKLKVQAVDAKTHVIIDITGYVS